VDFVKFTYLPTEGGSWAGAGKIAAQYLSWFAVLIVNILAFRLLSIPLFFIVFAGSMLVFVFEKDFSEWVLKVNRESFIELVYAMFLTLVLIFVGVLM
jgi:hypothetical protein